MPLYVCASDIVMAAVIVMALVLIFTPVDGTLASMAADTAIRIEMREFTFHPSIIRVAPGRAVRLAFVNRGRIAHQFQSAALRGTAARIVSETIYAEVGGVEVVRTQPGAWARLEFVPGRVGRFAFACTIEGHQEAGMRGVLEVVR